MPGIIPQSIYANSYRRIEFFLPEKEGRLACLMPRGQFYVCGCAESKAENRRG